MKTGWRSCQLGIAKIYSPFHLCYQSGMILHGPIIEILRIVPTTALALIIISGAIEGYFWGIGNLTILSRVLFLISGALLVFPGANMDIYGMAMLVVVFAYAASLELAL